MAVFKHPLLPPNPSPHPVDRSTLAFHQRMNRILIVFTEGMMPSLDFASQTAIHGQSQRTRSLSAAGAFGANSMRVSTTHNNPSQVLAMCSQNLTCFRMYIQPKPGLQSKTLYTESPGTIAEVRDSHFGRHLNTVDVHRKVVERHE